jgi:hypothetical protein
MNVICDELAAASRARMSSLLILGLTPQALCFRLLRRPGRTAKLKEQAHLRTPKAIPD